MGALDGPVRTPDAHGVELERDIGSRELSDDHVSCGTLSPTIMKLTCLGELDEITRLEFGTSRIRYSGEEEVE